MRPLIPRYVPLSHRHPVPPSIYQLCLLSKGQRRCLTSGPDSGTDPAPAFRVIDGRPDLTSSSRVVVTAASDPEAGNCVLLYCR